MSDRRTPFTVGDERQTLADFLDYLRDCVVHKADGLREDQARWSPVASGTSVAGLVKHLTMVEVAWFHWAFAGLDVEIPPSALADDDSLADVIAAYQAVCQTSNELVAAVPDLDQRCARQATAPEPMTLRWVLVHMIEETGRHAGHADIVRELLDGAVGR